MSTRAVLAVLSPFAAWAEVYRSLLEPAPRDDSNGAGSVPPRPE